MKSAIITAWAAAVLTLGCSLDSPLGVDQEVELHRNRNGIRVKTTQTATPGDASDVVCPAGENAGKNIVAGEGTPFGTYTGETIGCINPQTGVWSSIEGTLVTEDGDGLRLEMDPDNPGHFVFLDLATGAFETTGALIVVGGTGKFKRATGYTVFRSVGNLYVPGSTVTTNEGRLYLPKRKKHHRRSHDRHR